MNYLGALFSTPVALCSAGSHQSKIVKTDFDWINTYKAPPSPITVAGNVGVIVNMQGHSQAPLLDSIEMVMVDNSQNPAVPIQIFFPDTQFLLTVNGGERGNYPVITNNQICFVYCVPQFNLANLSNKTTISFCNFALNAWSAPCEFPLLYATNIIPMTTTNFGYWKPQAAGQSLIVKSLSVQVNGFFSPNQPVLSLSVGWYDASNCFSYIVSKTFQTQPGGQTQLTFGQDVFYDSKLNVNCGPNGLFYNMGTTFTGFCEANVTIGFFGI
jgi:hypothetical protein